MPLVSWSRITGIGHRLRCSLKFILDGCEHAKRRVTALAIVEDLEVFEDRVRELDTRLPTLSIEQLQNDSIIALS